MTLLVAALSMKSVPLVRFDEAETGRVEVTPVMFSVDLPVSLNVSLSVIAAEQVDAVERRVLRGGGDLGQDVVELAHQVAADRCADASATGADAVVKVSAVVSVPPIAPPAAAEPRVDEA